MCKPLTKTPCFLSAQFRWDRSTICFKWGDAQRVSPRIPTWKNRFQCQQKRTYVCFHVHFHLKKASNRNPTPFQISSPANFHRQLHTFHGLSRNRSFLCANGWSTSRTRGWARARFGLPNWFPKIEIPYLSGWWWLEHVLFSHTLGISIISIDFHIFQRGGLTTNQLWIVYFRENSNQNGWFRGTSVSGNIQLGWSNKWNRGKLLMNVDEHMYIVDGRNPAALDRWHIHAYPIIYGVSTI